MKKNLSFSKFQLLKGFFLLLLVVLVQTDVLSQNYKCETIQKVQKIYPLNFKNSDQIIEEKLNFDFNFDGKIYQTVTISPQGWLSFSQNTDIESLQDVTSLITPFLQNSNTEFAYQRTTIGSQNAFITQWKIQKSIITQVILFEDGNIEFAYKNLSGKEILNFQAGIITSTDLFGNFNQKIDKNITEVDFDVENSYVFHGSILNTNNKTSKSYTSTKNGTKTTDNFTTPGANTWTCPAGVNSITVHCIGGGGGGGGTRSNSRYGGGGGAGGSYATKVITVTPGNTYNLYVGAGGSGGTNGNGVDGEASWFNNTSEVYAVGGAGGAEPNGGTASGGLGTTTGCIGTTVYAGGDAGDGTGSGGISGGGGGGAGSLGSGGNASGRTGGTGTANGGGDGGNGRNNN